MEARGKRIVRRGARAILTRSDEQIIQALYTYRYLTALDTAYLLFSPGSHAYVRSLMSQLAGGTDLCPNAYLCRFPSPSISLGKPEKVFTLGIKGRNFLTREAGLRVDWYFRPSKYRSLSFSHLRHAMLLSRFVVAAQVVSRAHTCVSLRDARLSYELARHRLLVTPDAWLLFADATGRTYPVLVEIDRGTELEARFKEHVRARLRLIESGEYTRHFGTRAVMIAYATCEQTPAQAASRRDRMRAWTQEVLVERELVGWAAIFRFTSALTFETLYAQAAALVTEPVWYRPDSSTPVPLLGS